MKTNAEIKELVMARLLTFPSNKKICIGEHLELTRDDMIKHVRKDDELGKKIIEIELAYLKGLKQGIVT